MRLQLVVPGRRPCPEDAEASGDAGASGSVLAARGAGAGEGILPRRVRRTRVRLRGPVPAQVFAVVTVAPALVAVAWLVPGTLLLLAGRLLPLPAVLIAAPAAVMLCYLAARNLPTNWPRPHLPESQAGDAPAGVPAGALALMVMVAAGFGVWQGLLRSESLFAGDGPGTFLQYGYWIAGRGSAQIPVSAASFGPAAGLDFAVPGFSVTGGSLTPAVMPGLSLVLAGGTWAGGLGGALLMPAVLGSGALLSFAGLAGRLCGWWSAVAGEVVLAVSLPEVYTARSPYSEPLVQVLLLGGLCLIVDAQVASGRPGRGLVPAALGGLALGLTVLASAGSLAVLVPVVPVLAVLFAARRPLAAPFGAGLLAGAGTGLAAGLALSRPYLGALSGQLHLVGLCAAAAAGLGAVAALAALPRVLPRVRRAFAASVRVRWLKGQRIGLPSLGGVAQWTALVLPAIAFVALTERASLPAVPGPGAPWVIRTAASLLRAAGLQASGLRHYDASSLRWVVWHLGAPVLLLAGFGAAEAGRRTVQSLLEGRAPGTNVAAARLWGLPLLVTGWSAVTVLWDPAEAPWQPLASRRLVPAVLPGLVLLAMWMVSWLTSRVSAAGGSRALATGIGAGCLLALVVPPIVTTLDPALTAARPAAAPASSGAPGFVIGLQLRGTGASPAGGGSLAAMARLCAAIGPSASVLITAPGSATAFEQDIREFCGQPAARLTGPLTASRLGQAVRAIRQAGRQPVLLGPTRASVSLPGTTPQQAVLLRTTNEARAPIGTPESSLPATYSAWLSMPSPTR